MNSEEYGVEEGQKNLYIGDLEPFMDEQYLYSMFDGIGGGLARVKLIRNRSTSASEGYAFLEFNSHEDAATVLKNFSERPLPGAPGKVFKLNWGKFGNGTATQEYSLFVGDLAPDVTDPILKEYFRQFYPSIHTAKVITDVATGRPKGYGFVRFTDITERNHAVMHMNGHFLSNRPIRVSLATMKRSGNASSSSPSSASSTAAFFGGAAAGGGGGGGGPHGHHHPHHHPHHSHPHNLYMPHHPHPHHPHHSSDLSPTNTTLFIGGLSPMIQEDELRMVFGRFGEIIYVKVPQGKGCGFIQFVLRASAEAAMQVMNGQPLGGSPIRISWGRASNRSTPGSGNGGGPQIHHPHHLAAMHHHLAMHGMPHPGMHPMMTHPMMTQHPPHQHQHQHHAMLGGPSLDPSGNNGGGPPYNDNDNGGGGQYQGLSIGGGQGGGGRGRFTDINNNINDNGGAIFQQQQQQQPNTAFLDPSSPFAFQQQQQQQQYQLALAAAAASGGGGLDHHQQYEASLPTYNNNNNNNNNNGDNNNGSREDGNAEVAGLPSEEAIMASSSNEDDDGGKEKEKSGDDEDKPEKEVDVEEAKSDDKETGAATESS